MCVLKLLLENLKISIDVVISKFELNSLPKCLDKVCYIFLIHCSNTAFAILLIICLIFILGL